MKKPELFVLGLTGPTGSGKSRVAGRLAAEGIPVVDADRLARQVTEPGSPTLTALAKAFSPDILRQDGTLDRRKLAALAFASPEATARLDAVTHPAILALGRRQLAELAAAGHRAAVLDAPLLYESGADALCGRVAVVLAPREERRRRILARDGLTPQEADRRMAAQPEDAFYTGRGAYLIDNSGTLEELDTRAAALAAELRRWAAQASETP